MFSQCRPDLIVVRDMIGEMHRVGFKVVERALQKAYLLMRSGGNDSCRCTVDLANQRRSPKDLIVKPCECAGAARRCRKFDILDTKGFCESRGVVRVKADTKPEGAGQEDGIVFFVP